MPLMMRLIKSSKECKNFATPHSIPVTTNKLRKSSNTWSMLKLQVINSIIKQMPSRCVNHLVAIYNSTLKVKYFPIMWKKEQVVTIPKRGEDPKIPQNQRPLSLFGCLGEIYKKVLLYRLMKHVIANNLIPYESKVKSSRPRTQDKRPLGRDPDRSCCHRHTTSMIKLF